MDVEGASGRVGRSDRGEPLRVGLIGVGWGAVVQTPAFRMVPEFEVTAICSRQQHRVEEAGRKLGIDDVSTDWRSFVERDDLDVISICTPVDLHFEQTMAAIKSGKHVLVEKPVGLDSRETGLMRRAAEDAGVAHAVCFEGRWEPARLTVWDMVEAGHLGDPYLATARSGADYWHPTRGLQSEWMYRRAEGGGYLMGMGSHDIDFLCAMFGEPEAVCADVRTTVSRRPREDGSMLDVDADDTTVLAMRMANGMIVSILTTAVAYGRNFRGFEAYGSGGSLFMDGLLMGEERMVLRSARVGEAPTEVDYVDRRPRSGIEAPRRRAAGAITSLALMLEEWLPMFEGEKSRVPTLAAGDLVARVVDAARRSSDGGGWVRV
jgi:predicted dehydrogenase